MGNKLVLKPSEPYICEEHSGATEEERNQYIANITDGKKIGFKYFIFNKKNRRNPDLIAKRLILYVSILDKIKYIDYNQCRNVTIKKYLCERYRDIILNIINNFIYY